MERISTKQLMDEYFATLDPQKVRKNRGHIDRSEVYAYEQKIGKEILDMSDEELIEMIKTFGSNVTKAEGLGIAYQSYKIIRSHYKALWEYYCRNYGYIRNPWVSSEMLKGKNAYEQLIKNTDKLTFDKLQGYIKEVYESYSVDHYMPKYVECLILLFYCGFASPEEIVDTKRDMVNLDSGFVKLPNKTVHLSKRCLELMEYFYSRYEIPSENGMYYAVSYRGSYVKFFVRSTKVDSFDERDVKEVRAMLTRSMTKVIRQQLGIDLGYRRIYHLGFYDYIVGEVGETRAKELVNSVRTPEDTQQLTELAESYGIEVKNITTLKTALLQYA